MAEDGAQVIDLNEPAAETQPATKKPAAKKPAQKKSAAKQSGEAAPEAPAAPPVEPPAPESEFRYVDKLLDATVPNLSEYELTRSETVDSALAFLNELGDPMENLLMQTAMVWMADPSRNPFRGLSLPTDIDDVSLGDLQKTLVNITNAFQKFGELRSIADAVAFRREALFERRNKQGLRNNGANEGARKAFAYMRSDPEYLLYTKVEMARKWVEGRYYVYKEMVSVGTALMTAKSVAESRKNADATAENWQS